VNGGPAFGGAESRDGLSASALLMIVPPDLFAYENLWRQYRNCRRNKRNTPNQLRFELDAEAQLLTLAAGTAGPRLSARPGFRCSCGRRTLPAPCGPGTPLPRSARLSA